MSYPYSLLKTFSFITMAIILFHCNINNHDVLPTQKISLEDEKKAILKREEKIIYNKAQQIKQFIANKNYNEELCFLVDMNLQSGLKRFFVYDLTNDEILYGGLMAHGSCNENYLKDAKFSNKPSCGCSSLGKYSIGAKYTGKFGTAYKLNGLDSSNSNAYKRNIVLHAYYCVPDEETYPYPICNSLGCPMVSKDFFNELMQEIDNSPKPMLLWMFQ